VRIRFLNRLGAGTENIFVGAGSNMVPVNSSVVARGMWMEGSAVFALSTNK